MLWPESPLTQQFDAWSETLWFEYRQVGYHTWLKTLEARPVAPKNQTSFGRGPWMNYRNCIWGQRDANEQGMILYLYICVIVSRTYKLHWFQDLVCPRFFAGLGLRMGSGNCHYMSLCFWGSEKIAAACLALSIAGEQRSQVGLSCFRNLQASVSLVIRLIPFESLLHCHVAQVWKAELDPLAPKWHKWTLNQISNEVLDMTNIVISTFVSNKTEIRRFLDLRCMWNISWARSSAHLVFYGGVWVWVNASFQEM